MHSHAERGNERFLGYYPTFFLEETPELHCYSTFFVIYYISMYIYIQKKESHLFVQKIELFTYSLTLRIWGHEELMNN